LGERILADHHVSPYRLKDLLFGHHAAGVVHKVAQHLETLAPQRDRPGGPIEIIPREVEGERT
jgi:hypothetical protein